MSPGFSESMRKLHEPCEARLVADVAHALLRAVSAELVGQVGNLRPIVNRLARADTKAVAGRLTIGRRFPTCPTSSAEFLDLRRSESRLCNTRSIRTRSRLERRLQPRLAAPRHHLNKSQRRTRPG